VKSVHFALISTSAVFATGESDPESITADKVGVCWARPLISAIRAKPTLGGGVVTLAPNEAGPHSLASDGTALYWLTTGGAVRRSMHANGTITTLASGTPRTSRTRTCRRSR
jgi:hypothetical protein